MKQCAIFLKNLWPLIIQQDQKKNCVCVMECLSLFYLPTYLLTLPSTIKKQYKNEWEGKYLNTESVFSFYFSAAIRIGSKKGQIKLLTMILPVDMGNGPHQVLAVTFSLF